MLEMKFKRIIKDLNENKITELEIEEPLTQEEIKVLSEEIKKNTSLQYLRIHDGQIGDDGASQLANMLKVNKSLKSLNLMGNRITNPGAMAIAEALKTNTSLTKLSLDGRALDNRCIGNTIGNKAAGKMAEMLIVNKTLQKLNLRYNPIDEQGLNSLAKALNTNTSLQDFQFGYYHHRHKMIEEACERNRNAKTAKESILSTDLSIITKKVPSNLSAEESYQLSNKYETEGDYLKSYQYLVDASEKNHVKALGDICYLQDKQNENKYFQRLKEIADKGNAEAQLIVAQLIDPNEPELIFEYYKKATKQKLPEGYRWVGLTLQNGIFVKNNTTGKYKNVVPIDVPKSLMYYKEAVKLGYAKANVDIGRCFLYGTGVPKNASQAFYHFERAYLAYSALFNSTIDSYSVTNSQLLHDKLFTISDYEYCLENGIGVKRDENRAYQLRCEFRDMSQIVDERFHKLQEAAEEFEAFKLKGATNKSVINSVTTLNPSSATSIGVSNTSKKINF